MGYERVQTNLKDEDFEVLIDFCNRERISRAALVTCLILDFLDSTDKDHINSIIDEAKKISPGRPRKRYEWEDEECTEEENLTNRGLRDITL